MKKIATVLIDADILIYRAASFTDDSFDGEPIVSVRQARAFYNTMVDRWLTLARKHFEFEDYYAVFSKGTSFRKRLFSEYKANRKGLAIHPALFPLKDAIIADSRNVWMITGLEADDVIGLNVRDDSTLIISADKDFKTLPGNLFIPPSHGQTVGSVLSITKEEADLNWMRQTLMGDTIDNYKGIPKVGAKKAEKIIQWEDTVDKLWPRVLSAYLTAGLAFDDALRNARLARILRSGDYNFETNEVRLWVPDGMPEVWMKL